MTAVRIQAPAKVNLGLRILERRATGFHDLETLFQAIDLYDEVVVRTTPGRRIDLEVVGADVGPVADNLVVRAARAFLAAGSIESGLELRLRKRIPAGAGLGGGSSDAGATLRALDALFPGTVTPDGVAEIAGDIGSDVPFFVGRAGLALGQGRGEILRPLPALPEAHLVVGLPRVHVATASAFRALARARAGGDPVPGPLLVDGAVPRDWEGVARLAVNDFEPIVARDHPEVGLALDALQTTEPLFALLSGSGSAVFGIYAAAGRADAACVAAGEACRSVRFVRTRTLSSLPGLSPGGPST